MGKEVLMRRTEADNAEFHPGADCTRCPHHKALTSPLRGRKVPGGYGKCTRADGVCPPMADRIKRAIAPPQPRPATPAVVPLSAREKQLREELEAQITESITTTFYIVGRALAQIQAGKLYRTTHRTFELYVKDMWEVNRQLAYRYITAASVVDNIRQALPGGDDGDGDFVANWRQNESDTDQPSDPLVPVPIPINESQARALADLSPENQIIAWRKAVRTAPDGRVTAAHIRKTIKLLRGQKVETATQKSRRDTHQAVEDGAMSPELAELLDQLFAQIRAEQKDGWKRTDRATVQRVLKGLLTAVGAEV